MPHISDLCAQLESYLEPEQVASVYSAYLFASEAHEGQRRKSGEPYIYHPLAVAAILADLKLDAPTIIAAILHDVIEDTPINKETIVKEYGEEVASLVDGVSKLTNIEFENRTIAQAANFTKMMLAMVEDIRVILIKLADRLHNMRTLGVMRPKKRRRIAMETLEIYAPIALRLGLNSMRHELEELGFSSFYPMRSRILNEAVKRVCGNRKEVVNKVEQTVRERLDSEGLDFEVIGRAKHLYSIYTKMKEKQLAFNDVTDVFGLRIVVDSVDSCYRVLGVVHSLYKPLPGRFKDYIAIPKANGYQSLHTLLQSPYGFPVEVQIRTAEMERVAETGIAAHWLYKSGDSESNITRAREWLSSLLDMQQAAGDSMEFLESVKVDLFPDVVYVFTPKGEIKVLPRGSTPVDFAYSVHTDVGNRCYAAKVNRHLAPLNTKLQNGDSIEIEYLDSHQPSPTWLNFVITPKARTTIRHYLKNLQHDESIDLGRRMLEKALSDNGMELEALTEGQVNDLLQQYGLATLDDLLADVGLGNRMAILVVNTLQSGPSMIGSSDNEPRLDGSPLFIRGTEGTVVGFARCCRPIPGDHILGYLSAGRGIVIHAQRCNNIRDFHNSPEKWITVEWEKDIDGEFLVELKLDVVNKRGVLATVAAAIAKTGANIDDVSFHERVGSHTSINLTIAVHNRYHLSRIMRRLRTIEPVTHILRLKG